MEGGKKWERRHQLPQRLNFGLVLVKIRASESRSRGLHLAPFYLSFQVTFVSCSQECVGLYLCSSSLWAEELHLQFWHLAVCHSIFNVHKCFRSSLGKAFSESIGQAPFGTKTSFEPKLFLHHLTEIESSGILTSYFHIYPIS